MLFLPNAHRSERLAVPNMATKVVVEIPTWDGHCSVLLPIVLSYAQSGALQPVACSLVVKSRDGMRLQSACRAPPERLQEATPPGKMCLYVPGTADAIGV